MSTFYIVAGGPSLKGYNFKLLRNKHVIAINRSFEVLPNAEIVYFSDDQFFDWFKAPLLAHKGRLVTGSKKVTHPRVELYKFTGRSGLETENGKLRSGNDSTYAAINLAYHMGAKKIIILGLDMHIDSNGNTHYHGGYKTANLSRAYTKMLPFYTSLASSLLDHDIVALNASPDSSLDVFEKIPLEVAHLV